MWLKDFFKTLFWTLNPDRYEQLIAKPYSETFGYFSKLVIFGMILTVLISFPTLMNLPSEISSKMNNFETMELEGNFVQNSPIVLSSKPDIVVDLNKELENERILVNEKAINAKWYFWSYSINFEDFKNVNEHQESVSVFLTILFILLIPSLLVFFYLWFFIKYFVLAFVFSLIAWIVIKIVRYKLHYRYILKLSFFAITFIIILESVLLPFHRFVTWVPIVLYVLIGILVIYMNGEKEPKKHK